MPSMAAVGPHHLAPILLSLLSLPSVASLSFNYNFSQPNGYRPADLHVFSVNSAHPSSQEGSNAYLHSDMEMIHPDAEILSQSIGRVVYAHPVPLWDDAARDAASFSLTVSFCLRIYPGGESKNSTDDARIAFFLGPPQPAVAPPFSSGVNHSNPNTTRSKDQTVEIEFDAYLQKKSDNGGGGGGHMISVDVNYIVSKVQVNTTSPGNAENLSSGCTMMMVQIDYNGGTRRLDIGFRIGDVAHHINASVDLRESMPREAAIGFFSTSNQPIDLQNVLSWSFNSAEVWTNSPVTVTPPENEISLETKSPTIPWKQFLVHLGPWNWSVELNLQFQFQRIWDRINLAFNSSFSISLVYGIPNWN